MGVTTREARTPTRYDGYTIALHWLVALLVLVGWGLGETVTFLAPGAFRGNVRSVHILFGAAIAVLLLLRLRHHARGARSLPLPGIFNPLGKGVHYALHILLALQILEGVALAWLRGDSLFGVFALPGAGSAVWIGILDEFHDSGGTLIMFLAGVHTVAALVHHYVWRDDVMRRMLPGRG